MKIDGKEIANEILQNLKARVEKLKKQDVIPHIAIILIGDDPASKAYVKQKELKSAEIGAQSTAVHLELSVKNSEVLNIIDKFNNDPKIQGIIVQRPVPKQINEQDISLAVIPQKDIDGFHPDSKFPTPIWDGVLKILIKIRASTPGVEPVSFEEWLKSKNVIVVGKGTTGGGPIRDGLKSLGIEPTIIDSKTKDTKAIMKNADIIISAVGKGKIIEADMLKKSVVLISVGMHRGKDGKLHGDYNMEEVKDIASFYTPVPGGVGPVNAACLLENLVLAAENLLR